LRTVDYRDADQIVTFLTRDFGKLAAIARSAKKSRHRFGGALQAFCIVDIEFSRSRDDSSLAALKTAQIRHSFDGILTDFERLKTAGRGMESIRNFLGPDHVDPEIFQVAIDFLGLLSSKVVNERIVFTLFQIALLSALGFTPRFSSCIGCGRVPDQRQWVLFHPQRGSIV